MEIVYLLILLAILLGMAFLYTALSKISNLLSQMLESEQELAMILKYQQESNRENYKHE